MFSIIIKKQGVRLVALLSLFVIPHSAAAQALNLEKGQILFEQICAKCHGADGSKTTSVGKAVSAKDLRSPAVQTLTDVELYKQISEGTTNMPPFGGTYRNEQINDLIGYLRELSKEQIAAARTPDPETGQILFEQICAKCHGADGSNTTSAGRAVRAKDLRSPAVQTRTDVELYKQISEGTTNMPPFRGNYKKAEINDLVSYLRKLGNGQTITAQKPDPETGKILFEQTCAKCHGADGSKTTSVGKAVKAEDLRGTAVQQLTDAEIYKQIAGGTKNMPPFEGTYRKAQINDLIAYVRRLGKALAESKKSS
jgi:cytochrome c6